MYLYLLICITEYIPNRGGLRLGVNPPLRIFHIHWPTSNHSPGQIPQFTFMLQCYLWPKLLWNDPRWAGQWPQFLESNSHQRTAWETRYKMTMNCINMSHQSQLKVSPGHLLLSCLSKPLSTRVLLNLWRNRQAECRQILRGLSNSSQLYKLQSCECMATHTAGLPAPQAVLQGPKDIFKLAHTKNELFKERPWAEHWHHNKPVPGAPIVYLIPLYLVSSNTFHHIRDKRYCLNY